MMKKVVVLGPESTGKSTLCQLLSEYFHCPWVPEFAREYLIINGTDYSYDDLLTIAKGQLSEEDRITSSSASRAIFIDTDMHVMKVWCEFVFGKCHDFIINELNKRHYDLYLLCNVDLPWVKDELREYPDLETRQTLYNIYKQLLIEEQLPWVDISGTYSERLQKAINAVSELIDNK